MKYYICSKQPQHLETNGYIFDGYIVYHQGFIWPSKKDNLLGDYYTTRAAAKRALRYLLKTNNVYKHYKDLINKSVEFEIIESL